MEKLHQRQTDRLTKLYWHFATPKIHGTVSRVLVFLFFFNTSRKMNPKVLGFTRTDSIHRFHGSN